MDNSVLNEDALLAQALWAAEQAELYAAACSSDGGDSGSDYEGSKKCQRRQQRKKAAGSKPRGRRTAAPTAAGTSSATTRPATTDGSNSTQTAFLHPSAAASAGAAVSSSPRTADGAHTAAGTAAGEAEGAAAAACEAGGPEGLTALGRRRRKDSGQKREKGKSWSEAEEAAFLSGLEAHGRDWKAIAADVGSRDSRAVASHAQKHFIRLCMAGEALPARVQESGPGYTLSGKLLDPDSSAAAAYGFSYQLLLERLEGERLATALSGVMPINGDAAGGGDGGDDAKAGAAPAVGADTAAGGFGAGVGVDAFAAHGQVQVGSPAAGPALKRQRRAAVGQAAQRRSTAVAGAGHPPPPQQQQQQQQPAMRDADKVAAILAAAPRPPLAASEAAALAAAAAAAAQGKQQPCMADGDAGPCLPGGSSAAGGAAATAAAAAAAVDADDGSAGSTEQRPAGQAAGTTGDAGATGSQGSAAAPAADPQVAAAAAAAAAAGGGDATGRAPTDYVRARPRRASVARRAQLGGTSESTELVVPQEFIGPAGSGARGAQPFSVDVDLQALVVMEVAVHLSGAEVIGLLGGSWAPHQRRLTITSAYPCRRAEGSVAATSVEMDAAAEVEARAAMAEAGQRCVGWYHSHPVFEACPSRKDMDNQRNYQALTRDATDSTCSTGGSDGCTAALPGGSTGGSGGCTTSSSRCCGSCSGGGSCQQCALEPFVGFILSPFDPALPLPHTSIKAFVVQQRGGAVSALEAYNIRYGLVNSSKLPDASTQQCLRTLLASTRHDLARTELASPWRPFTLFDASSGRLLGPPLTKLGKLLAGLTWLCSHTGDSQRLRDWLTQLCSDIEELWDVPLSSPQQRQLPPQLQ